MVLAISTGHRSSATCGYRHGSGPCTQLKLLDGMVGWTPPTALVTGPPSDASAECWRGGSIPETQGMQPPIMSVRETLAEVHCLATGADVKGNHQSGGAKHDVSYWKLGHILDEVPMHGKLPAVG